MKHAATRALASLAREPVTEAAGFTDQGLEFNRNYIIPKPFYRRLLARVSAAVAEAAMNFGVARKPLDLDEYITRLCALARLSG